MYIDIHYKKSLAVHRTQIYLQDELHESLKVRARSDGISVSELIRRTLEKDIQKDPLAESRSFFARLEPLQSWADVTPEAYVDALRSKSRLMR